MRCAWAASKACAAPRCSPHNCGSAVCRSTRWPRKSATPGCAIPSTRKPFEWSAEEQAVIYVGPRGGARPQAASLLLLNDAIHVSPHRRALIELHICVVLWGFTAILGKLITLPAHAARVVAHVVSHAGAGLFPARVARARDHPAATHRHLRRHRLRRGAALAGVLRLGEAGERLGGGHLHGAGPGGHGAHRAGDHRRALRTT